MLFTERNLSVADVAIVAGDAISRIPRLTLLSPHAVQREAVHRRCGVPVGSSKKPGSRVCSATLRAALRPGHEALPITHTTNQQTDTRGDLLVGRVLGRRVLDHRIED